ncbi:hypothetical protein [Nonomuraea sp. NPDC049158]|uniref:hypothetical protein n=1 Tax=Nonomuraea sp. NPDC049158 TaxID=3155649 RepID=UPI0033E3B6BF
MDEVTLLAQAVPDVPPPSAETVARARARLAARQAPLRVLRTRRHWGWTLGAAVATTAVVTTVVMVVSNLVGGSEPAPPPAAPPSFERAPDVYKGLDRLADARASRSATKVSLRFRPTSKKIAIVVFCQTPGSIFMSREGTSSAGGMCGPDGSLSMLADKAYEPGWLGREHKVTFWVFPPDAPAVRGRGSCPSGCEKQYDLSKPGTADQLAAKLGKRPGGWSVAAYDVPAGPTASSTG